ncbi:hypothetical protein [Rummeliibacillus pycnus]|uniref:hypothetical protein n=1 Tax=Rummeliibacillus pycnus TaxID=101070 RepID=UPI003D26FFFC
MDNIKYKSNTHGLNADFLELFSFALTLENPLYKISDKKSKYEIVLGELHLEVDNTLGLPVFKII